MYKTIVLGGLVFCTLLFLSYPSVRNFTSLLMVPVGDQGINIVTVELAILRNPNDATAYYNRAVLYSQSADYEAAIDDLTKAISLNSEITNHNFDTANLYFKRGSIYQEIGDSARAIADYHRAADLYWKQRKYPEYEYIMKLIKSSNS
jgi:tetratricopeptide (TPR) repeat protein